MDYKSKEHLDFYQEFLEWYWKDDQELEENAPNNLDDAHLYWMYSSWLAGSKAKESRRITEQEPAAEVSPHDVNHIYWFAGHPDNAGCGSKLYAAPPDTTVLQAKCDAYLANVVLLDVEVEALTKERDEWVARHEDCCRLMGECMQDRAAMETERDALMAARFAYASEFALDIDGEPDVGSVHQNIRALKAAAKLALDALYEAQTADDDMAKWDRNLAAIDALKKAVKD